MKKLIQQYTEMNLVLRIVAGLVVGIVLALILPPAIGALSGSIGADILGFIAGVVTICGTLFVGALKGIAPMLVFFLVSTALANAKMAAGVTMKRVILLYIVGTVLASILAVVVSWLIPVNMVFPENVDLSGYNAPDGIAEVITALLTKVVANPVDAIANANYLGILFWAILTGIALRRFAAQGVKDGLNALSSAFTLIVRFIIQCAPFGIMGLIYAAVSESGLSIFIDYGMLLVVLVSAMVLMFLVINPLIVFVNTRKNPYPLVFSCIANSAVTAFFTRSSAANIPVNMDLCDKMGLDEENYSISIPLGATINMEGAAITISVMTLAACNTLGISVDFGSAVILSVLAAIGACGASGVAGGSLLLIPMACSLFGIPADISACVVGVGFIIGVVQDSMETALNSSTDVLFTATAEVSRCIKEGKPIPASVPGMGTKIE